MVLHSTGCGRVGHRRAIIPEEPSDTGGLFGVLNGGRCMSQSVEDQVSPPNAPRDGRSREEAPRGDRPSGFGRKPPRGADGAARPASLRAPLTSKNAVATVMAGVMTETPAAPVTVATSGTTAPEANKTSAATTAGAAAPATAPHETPAATETAPPETTTGAPAAPTATTTAEPPAPRTAATPATTRAAGRSARATTA